MSVPGDGARRGRGQPASAVAGMIVHANCLAPAVAKLMPDESTPQRRERRSAPVVND